MYCSNNYSKMFKVGKEYQRNCRYRQDVEHCPVLVQYFRWNYFETGETATLMEEKTEKLEGMINTYFFTVISGFWEEHLSNKKFPRN